MNIQFIYDVVESNYSNLECYSVYDFTDNNLVEDVKLNKVSIMLDRKNKMIKRKPTFWHTTGTNNWKSKY